MLPSLTGTILWRWFAASQTSTIARSRVALPSSRVATSATSAADRRLDGTRSRSASRARRKDETSAAACSGETPERVASSSGPALLSLEMLPKSCARRRAVSKPFCPRWPHCRTSATSSSAVRASTPQRVRRSLGGSKCSLVRTSSNRAQAPVRQVQRNCTNCVSWACDYSGADRNTTERTVDGHQRSPLCAVGVPSALRSRAIWARLFPAARSVRIRLTTSGVRAAGRPSGCGAREPSLGGRRLSAMSRSSSSTGTSLAPHGISMVSMCGRTRRLNVERLIPSASAACVRV